MCRLILKAPPITRYSGIDQAIHNYIMIEGLVGNAQIVPNGFAVTTIPSDLPHGLIAMPDGILKNADGSVSEIVHQYDRDPALMALITDRYRR